MPKAINPLNNPWTQNQAVLGQLPASISGHFSLSVTVNGYDSVKYMTVEGHDGTKYMVNNNGNKIPAKDLINKYNNYNKKYFDYFNNQVCCNNMDQKLAWQEHSHYILTDLAKELNWIYNRIITDKHKPIAEKIAEDLKKEGLIK